MIEFPEKILDGCWFLHEVSQLETGNIYVSKRFETTSELLAFCEQLPLVKMGQYLVWDCPAYSSAPGPIEPIEFDLFSCKKDSNHD